MKDQVVFITGGTRGLGLSAARECLALGAKVALNYRGDDTQAEAAKKELNAGDKVLLLKGDVSDLSLHKGFLQSILAAFGRIDVLVNNAGVASRQFFMEATEAQYDHVMATNVKSMYFLSQMIAQHWLDQKQAGNIVNVSSIAGHKASLSLTPYCISKAAVLSMTKCMAKELAPQGIRVNSVSPGVIATDINREHWENNTEFWQGLMKNIPAGHAGVPDNIGKAIVFLVQNEFAVGTDIIIDGGALA